MSPVNGSRASRRAFFGLLACALLGAASAARAGAPPGAPTTGKPNPVVEMTIENHGTVTIELFPGAAPKTVAHFVDLVNRHFYDGILFHRVIPEFVAQAGDPKSKKIDGAKLRDIKDSEVSQKYDLGGGGSGKTVPLEPKLPHERGTLGLARSQDIDSGDSQFFFNLRANHALDSGYCVFGKVVKGKTASGKMTDGLDIMDAIEQGDRIKSARVVGAPKPKK